MAVNIPVNAIQKIITSPRPEKNNAGALKSITIPNMALIIVYPLGLFIYSTPSVVRYTINNKSIVKNSKTPPLTTFPVAKSLIIPIKIMGSIPYLKNFTQRASAFFEGIDSVDCPPRNRFVFILLSITKIRRAP
jgi:hypothetical protein